MVPLVLWNIHKQKQDPRLQGRAPGFREEEGVTSKGQDMDKIGTRQGQDRDIIGTRKGQDSDKTRKRQGQDKGGGRVRKGHTSLEPKK